MALLGILQLKRENFNIYGSFTADIKQYNVDLYSSTKERQIAAFGSVWPSFGLEKGVFFASLPTTTNQQNNKSRKYKMYFIRFKVV